MPEWTHKEHITKNGRKTTKTYSIECNHDYYHMDDPQDVQRLICRVDDLNEKIRQYLRFAELAGGNTSTLELHDEIGCRHPLKQLELNYDAVNKYIENRSEYGGYGFSFTNNDMWTLAMFIDELQKLADRYDELMVIIREKMQEADAKDRYFEELSE